LLWKMRIMHGNGREAVVSERPVWRLREKWGKKAPEICTRMR
jgi:hypothetical protein